MTSQPERLDKLKDEEYRPLAIRYTKRDGSEVQYNLGCGLSLKDFALVLVLYIAFYSFLLGFTVLLLKGAIDTADKSTLLWTFNFIGMIFGILTSVAVKIGSKAQDDKKASMLLAEEMEQCNLDILP